MKLAVIEGLDGSGKSTQINLLRNFLDQKGIRHKYLHFPRTEKGGGVYGDLIARFLRGEFGNINQVHPYLVALIFAGDRNDAKSQIENWLKQGYLVLLDRYVNSNIAFQCAKLPLRHEQEKLKEWILDLEFNYHKLPVPDISIFLDVPFEFTMRQLKKRREGIDRDYLLGQTDIHEEDLDFQKKVREIYLSIKGSSAFTVLNCGDSSGEIMEPEKIFRKLIKSLDLK